MFPTYLFLLGRSLLRLRRRHLYQSVASGLVSTVCAAVKNSLDGLLAMCDHGTVNVAFLAFDSAVHFYQLSVAVFSSSHAGRRLAGDSWW